MDKFDANENGQEGFCWACKADDLETDHSFDCFCDCHHPKRIKFLESERDALAAEVQKLKAEMETAHKVIREVDATWFKKYAHLRSLAQQLYQALNYGYQSLTDSDEANKAFKAMKAWDAFEKEQSK